MRKTLVALAIVCTSVACGGLLGFGDDDEEPPPTPSVRDAAQEASEADGSADAPRVCQQLADDFESYTDQSQLPASGWRRYFGMPDCGVLSIDGGAFVAERPEAACTANNTGIFRWFEGGVRSVECTFDVRVNSFAGSGDFFEYRVEGTPYQLYRASGGFNDTLGLRGRVVARSPDGTLVKDEYRYDAGLPEAGASFRVHAKIDLGGKPTFSWTRDDGTAFEGELPDPGTPSLVQLYLGVTETDAPRAVTVDNVSCQSCQ